MEIVKRYPRKHQTLWRAEWRSGKLRYQVTNDRDGIAVEPVSLNFPSQRSALAAARWADRQVAAIRESEE